MNDLERPDITRAIMYGSPLGFEEMNEPPEDESEAGCDDIESAEYGGSSFGYLFTSQRVKKCHARRA